MFKSVERESPSDREFRGGESVRLSAERSVLNDQDMLATLAFIQRQWRETQIAPHGCETPASN
jgi:hypothetical protein